MTSGEHMYRIEYEIEERKRLLKKVIGTLAGKIPGLPGGRLRISGSSFYLITEKGDTCGRYISRSEKEYIKTLAQAGYTREVYSLAQKELAFLNGGRIYTGQRFDDVYGSLNEKRQQLVDPVFMTDKMYAEKWLSRPYKPLGFDDSAPEYYSPGKLRVRSKSEVIITGRLEYFGVIFLYEFPLVINGISFRPDFLILKMPEKKEFYWEHFGLMDDEDYREKSLRKINLYAENGIVQGDNLIITMESSRVPLNTTVIDRIIQQNLI